MSLALPNIDPEAAHHRAVALKRMRWVASGLLFLAAIVFFVTHPWAQPGTFWAYVNAGAEASMVGAVADWFAVTALFRHPLGLPVPHTAIIPRKKDKLGRSLEEFVTQNFLTVQTVTEKISSSRLPHRTGSWLATPGKSELVAEKISPALIAAINSVDDASISAIVEQGLLPRLAREPVANLAGTLLEQIVKDQAHSGAMDVLAREAHAWASDNRAVIGNILLQKSPGWSPSWLDDAVVSRSYRYLLDWLKEVRDDPQHQVRQAITSMLARLAEDMQHDEETIAKVERLQKTLLAHPQVPKTTLSLWQSGKSVVISALSEEDGMLRRKIVEYLQRAGRHLRDDPAWQQRTEEALIEAVTFGLEHYGAGLTQLISSTVEQWDGKETAARIEGFVGRDLQFIRINGTVVGGLVGVFLYFLTQIIPS